MPRNRIGPALAAAATLIAASSTMPAHAVDQNRTHHGYQSNAIGMSPNVTAAYVTPNWTNARDGFNFFVSKGLTKQQAAGIIGNYFIESGMDPTAQQVGGAGRGLAQWSAGGRWDTYKNDNVVWYAKRTGQRPSTLRAQLHFTWFELTTISYYGLRELRSATTLETATEVFMRRFEGCGTCHYDRRLSYAQETYARYA